MNAPEAGTIKEFLVNEEDTVTVGQDIVKMKLGTSPSPQNVGKPSSETQDGSTSADAAQRSDDGKAPQAQKEPEESSEPTREDDSSGTARDTKQRPSEAKQEEQSKAVTTADRRTTPNSKSDQPAATGSTAQGPSREERRVIECDHRGSRILLTVPGQNEPNAPAYRRET